MIACFLSNISAKYYKNPSMLSRVIAKNVGDVFFETQRRVTASSRIFRSNTSNRTTKYYVSLLVTSLINIFCHPRMRLGIFFQSHLSVCM